MSTFRDYRTVSKRKKRGYIYTECKTRENRGVAISYRVLYARKSATDDDDVKKQGRSQFRRVNLRSRGVLCLAG